MNPQIEDVFSAAIDMAASEAERAALVDAREAARLVHALPARDRAVVVSVLEKSYVLCDLADDIAAGRVVAHPALAGRFYLE